MAEIERAGHGLDPAAGWQRDGSPYHAGEQAVQLRAGTRGKAERMGRRIIRDFMPDQHRAFFAGLPYLIVGSLDGRQRPWASILAGPPGFVQSPDPRLLRVEAKPLIDDPLAANLRQGAPVAFLGIQLDARRRNRMNGHIVDLGDGAVSAAVDQSFGNCPHTFKDVRWFCLQISRG
jgi:predicted pyridoxine 5'-phosphate oxidase superfamily flavin-nucleotide-binding protein